LISGLAKTASSSGEQAFLPADKKQALPAGQHNPSALRQEKRENKSAVNAKAA